MDMRQPTGNQPLRKDRIDAPGALALVTFSALMGFNQPMVKFVNEGMSPVFQAGLRSLFAIPMVLAWIWWRRSRLSLTDGSLAGGIACGVFFAMEFLLLFLAIDYTTVSRSAVLFYTMPIWVAGVAHFLIPGEGMTRRKAIGLALAIAGVALALSRNEQPATDRAFRGDMLALGAALCWAAIAITARVTQLSRSTAEMQLLYQLAISAPLLIGAAVFAGPFFREMTPLLWGIFAFQVVGVASLGFLSWFMILKIYPASDMASFAFLTPLFSVLFGATILDETLGWNVIAALVLIGAGIRIVNRRGRAKAASVTPPS